MANCGVDIKAREADVRKAPGKASGRWALLLHGARTSARWASCGGHPVFFTEAFPTSGDAERLDKCWARERLPPAPAESVVSVQGQARAEPAPGDFGLIGLQDLIGHQDLQNHPTHPPQVRAVGSEDWNRGGQSQGGETDQPLHACLHQGDGGQRPGTNLGAQQKLGYNKPGCPAEAGLRRRSLGLLLQLLPKPGGGWQLSAHVSTSFWVDELPGS